MVQRPRTLVTLSLVLLGSLALAACDAGAWESDESQASNAVEVGHNPTFAPNSSPQGAQGGYPPSDSPSEPPASPPADETPSAGDEPLASEGQEQDEESSPTEEAPAPELQTPPDEEKPAKEEEASPLPPAEESAPEQEEEEEPSSISSNSTGDGKAAAISLTFSPFTNAGTPTILTASVEGPVGYVFYEVDSGTKIGAGMGADFELSYTFWSEGTRKITVRGYNDAGAEVATDSGFIVILPSAGESPSDSDSSSPPPSEPSGCPEGKVEDCNGVCINASWVGDGICDDGANTYVNFMCEQFNMDGGDCGAVSSSGSSCAAGEEKDCNGLCVKSKWIGDDFCDDGTEYNVDLNCAQFAFDQGDCAPSSGGSSSSGASGTPVGNLSQLPYFYQYNNSLHPSASCQNTSIAMVLKYYGWSGTPDTITAAFGKNKAQSPAGLAQVFNHYAENIGISQRIVAHTNGSIAGLKALLAAGKPVIIHGYFTGFGHVLVVTGYTGSGYVVNDPAGKWAQTWKGGYPFGGGSTAGKQLTYGASAFELAVSSTNGSNYAPLWYHEVVE